ncbi:tail fiber domain-containing protein [Pantoea sp. CTOTU46764]|uniref:tail fiber domain-containing protein n=1 Tax=Pantoea sp. CTOTU46764 TaxID=2953854 RepID=UPI0028964376|nr:tail fiber domain-containing protein [Pantoea sp. CTOTU46764]
MPVGTIALTNGSNAVTGTGTSFTTELKQGDFVYVTVGSAPYTLVVSSVTSNTQLTLSIAFDGPTTSGLAWNAVPASMQVAITQKILNDFAQVARGRILDFQNWQKIYSGDQSVTVTRPDRTTFTGPSWGYMSTQFGNKLDKAQNLNDLTDKSTARTNLGLGELATFNGPLSINKGGTGSASPFGTAANTFAQGNDSRLGTINNKTGGTLTSETIVRKTITSVSGTLVNGGLLYQGTIVDQNGTTIRSSIFPELNNGQFSQTTISNYDSGSNTSKYWQFRSDGNAYAINGTWQNSSDKRFKSDLKAIDNALAKVKSLTGYTGNRDGSKFTGLIAQDLQAVLPEAVSVMGPYTLQSNINGMKKGEIIPDALGVAYGDTVGLLVEAIKELSGVIDNQNSVISELQQRLKAIDGLDA